MKRYHVILALASGVLVGLAPMAIKEFRSWNKKDCVAVHSIQTNWQEIFTAKCPVGYVIVKYTPLVR